MAEGRKARSYLRVLMLVWRAKPVYLNVAVSLAAISAAVTPTQIWLSKVIIDRITESVGLAGASSFEWDRIVVPILGILALWSIAGTCRTLSVEATMIASINFRNFAEYLLLKKASELDVAFFETPGFYDKMENALKNIPQAQGLVFQSLTFFGSLLSVVATLALLLKLHPLAVVVLVVSCAPQAVVQGHYAKSWWSIETARVPERRMALYFAGLLRSRDAVKEVRIFGLGDLLLSRFKDFWDRYFKAEMRVRLSKERANALL